jgi:hypothetical protein
MLNDLGGLAQALNTFLVSANGLALLPDPTTIWQALPTCALNADGSLGTPDESPNNANPIDVRVVQGLDVARSYTQYSALYTLIKALVSSQADPTNIGIVAPFLGHD